MWNCFKIVFWVLRNCWEFVKSENYELPSISGRWYCRLVTSNLRSHNISNKRWGQNYFLGSSVVFGDFWPFLKTQRHGESLWRHENLVWHKTTKDNMKEVNFEQNYFTTYGMSNTNEPNSTQNMTRKLGSVSFK